MKLQRLHIKNFKSIVDLEIIEPNPFTVFIGPNGSGKSNIFEALEYRLFSYQFGDLYRELDNLFPNVYSYNAIETDDDFYGFPTVEISFDSFSITNMGLLTLKSGKRETENDFYKFRDDKNYRQFVDNHSEIFISNTKREKIPIRSDSKLSTSGFNFEKILKRIFQDEKAKAEIIEVLDLLIPELAEIEIIADETDGEAKLRVFEKHTKRSFSKSLISDGTYNILCLLTAIYQSDEPQFLCIEEPENGLSPYAIELLVELMRNKCKEAGHYIWLNTHSATLVRQLRADELILVDKENGATQVKQFEGKDFHGLRMDEAWLTNALGGGLPW